jgi:fatty-acyl-CoA synthase
MKMGFSSLVCPEWDFATQVDRAAEFGFDAIEICLSRDTRISSQVADVVADPAAARARLSEKHVELGCLGAAFPLHVRDGSQRAGNVRMVRDAIELAGQLGCPFVRVPLGTLATWDTRPHALSRAAEAFREVAPHAVDHGVTLLVENGGDFADAGAVWFVLDAVSHPAVRTCWNPCVAAGVRERPTISIPRLARRIAAVHVCDAVFDDRGVLQEYRLPGDGDLEWARAIELLTGVFFDGYLIFHWPKALDSSLPEPQDVLGQVAAYLRERMTQRQAVLSAYKADKHAPNYGPPAEPPVTST